jgi:hypothetical protein
MSQPRRSGTAGAGKIVPDLPPTHYTVPGKSPSSSYCEVNNTSPPHPPSSSLDIYLLLTRRVDAWLVRIRKFILSHYYYLLVQHNQHITLSVYPPKPPTTTRHATIDAFLPCIRCTVCTVRPVPRAVVVANHRRARGQPRIVSRSCERNVRPAVCGVPHSLVSYSHGPTSPLYTPPHHINCPPRPRCHRRAVVVILPLLSRRLGFHSVRAGTANAAMRSIYSTLLTPGRRSQFFRIQSRRAPNLFSCLCHMCRQISTDQ